MTIVSTEMASQVQDRGQDASVKQAWRTPTLIAAEVPEETHGVSTNPFDGDFSLIS